MRKAKFNGLLTHKPLFAMARGVRCVLSVYLAWQFGAGRSAGLAGNGGQFGRTGMQEARRPQGLLYYAGHPGRWGRGVAEKQPVPSGRGVGYIIRTYFPIPRHLTSLCLTASLLAKLPHRLSSLSAYGVQRDAEWVPEKRAVGSLETARRNDNSKFTGLWRYLPWPGFCAHGVGYKFM